MKPRITASKMMMTKIQEKVSLANGRGDLPTLHPDQALHSILRADRYEDMAQIIGMPVETIRLWINSFLREGPWSWKC